MVNGGQSGSVHTAVATCLTQRGQGDHATTVCKMLGQMHFNAKIPLGIKKKHDRYSGTHLQHDMVANRVCSYCSGCLAVQQV